MLIHRLFRALLHKLNNVRLRNKMIMAYIFIIMVPLIIVGGLVVQAYRQAAIEDATAQTINNVERIKSRTVDVLNVSIEVSNRLSLDEKLMQLVNTRYEQTIDVLRAYQDYETIRTLLDFNREVSRIKVYVDNPSLINNWEFIPLDRSTVDAFWYRSALGGNGLGGWFYFPDSTRGASSKLSLVRQIRFPEFGNSGVLVIDVNTEYLNSILRQEPFETLLLDQNSIVVASNSPQMIGQRLQDTYLKQSLYGLGGGKHEIAVDGRESMVFIEDFMPDTSYNKLRIISIFSIESIVADANRISRIGMTVITISFAVAIVLIYVISSMLVNRLLNLSRQIHKVSKGNFQPMLEVDGNDEIGQLSMQFNQMVFSINDLMQEVSSSKEQKNQLELKQNEIKLKMLASQINPHFLFNALESIRMKAHLSGQPEIAQTVKLLGRLMRKNLELGRRASSLKDELEIIRCYLDIQKFRHEERLHYRLNIEPGAEEVTLPPLIVQPIVENAVIHGLERKDAGGTVTVRAVIDGGMLRVAVTDDGVGITPERLESIRRMLDDHEANRIGLSNVHQRIQLTYGAEYGLTVHSEEGRGTSVQFAIPMGVGYV